MVHNIAHQFIHSIGASQRWGRQKALQPLNIPAISNLVDLELHESITFFAGENGSGKSTLLEAIAQTMGFGAQGGTFTTSLQVSCSGL